MGFPTAVAFRASAVQVAAVFPRIFVLSMVAVSPSLAKDAGRGVNHMVDTSSVRCVDVGAQGADASRRAGWLGIASQKIEESLLGVNKNHRSIQGGPLHQATTRLTIRVSATTWEIGARWRRMKAIIRGYSKGAVLKQVRGHCRE
ncbi:MAG: hypothetical protein AAFY88_29210, partial [Acidobacteriota bacterium]